MSEPTRPQFDALIAPSGTVHDEPSTENALTPLPSDAATDSVYLGSPSAEASDDPSPTMITAGMPLIPGYMLKSELGRGGMGVVFHAVQLGLNRPVALKMVLAGAYADAAQRSRFRSEAETIAKLHHPGIVQIYEIGEFEGMPFYSLELTEGGSLADKLTGQPFAPREAAQFIETLAQAVHVAHQKGVVHRDLKPGNILLTAEGAPKISDFGLAKSADPDALHTVDGAILGTPTYMAPEQAAGRLDQIGPATDVYALGAILYEMLVGKPPFKGASMMDTLEQVRHGEPRDLHLLQQAVPRDLATISLKCLEKEPRNRYGSAIELAEDLQRYLNDRPIRARRTPLWERGRKWVRRHPTLTTVLLAMGFLLVSLGGVAWWVWDTYYRVTVAYHATLVRRHGTWEGVGPLTENQVQYRSYSFKLYLRGGRVEWCDIVNGNGHHSSEHPLRILLDGLDSPTTGWRIARIEFRRNERGRVVEERLYDRSGQLVWAFHYTTENMGHFTDANGLPRTRAGSGASYVQFRRNADGFEEETIFLDAKGERQPAADGTYGVRMQLTPNGLRRSITCLGKDGKPARHRSGATVITHEYDARGHVLATAYWDQDRKPVRYRGTYHCIAYRRDPFGNELEQTYFDVDGQPMLHPLGYARMQKEHDGRGNCISITYLDLAGQPVMTKEGHAELRRMYDTNGDCRTERSFDTQGQPVLNERGYHLKQIKLDAGGYPVEEIYADAQGHRVRNRFGYARRVLTPGSQELVQDVRYFDVDGRRLAVESVIATLYPGSLAERLGLKVGDVLLTYGGEGIRHRYHLENRRHQESPESPETPLGLRRGQQTLEILLPPGLLGITLEDYVKPGSFATPGRRT